MPPFCIDQPCRNPHQTRTGEENLVRRRQEVVPQQHWWMFLGSTIHQTERLWDRRPWTFSSIPEHRPSFRGRGRREYATAILRAWHGRGHDCRYTFHGRDNERVGHHP